MESVYIGSDYGRLKEVIVGEASGEASGFNPSLQAAWLQEALKVLPAVKWVRNAASAAAG
ncbi:hypothetical protein ACIZ62_18435 [Acetobacterium carbinolicum]|uniref:hypothetical protein n=1 Tax=Acetobacterium carbinolicum TaxID=52690 RepID=UPI0039BF14D4